MVLVLALVLIPATSLFYAAAGLSLPCITRGHVRPFGSVEFLDTEGVIGGVEFRIDCLKHRHPKLFLSSSTVVSLSIRENENKILVCGAFDCLCSGTLFPVPGVPVRAPGERFLKRAFDSRKKKYIFFKGQRSSAVSFLLRCLCRQYAIRIRSSAVSVRSLPGPQNVPKRASKELRPDNLQVPRQNVLVFRFKYVTKACTRCYAIAFPGRNSTCRSGCWRDFDRQITEIRPGACPRPSGGLI